jgi:hypothetical protein
VELWPKKSAAHRSLMISTTNCPMICFSANIMIPQTFLGECLSIEAPAFHLHVNTRYQQKQVAHHRAQRGCHRAEAAIVANVFLCTF